VTPLLEFILDGCPALYGHPRAGKGGEEFMAYKFETMRESESDEQWKTWMANDVPRVTRLGKMLRSAALDELLQVLNIAKSDISFVGPRSLMPEQSEGYSIAQAKFRDRHRISPNLTGLPQVNLPRRYPPAIRLKTIVATRTGQACCWISS